MSHFHRNNLQRKMATHTCVQTPTDRVCCSSSSRHNGHQRLSLLADRGQSHAKKEGGKNEIRALSSYFFLLVSCPLRFEVDRTCAAIFFPSNKARVEVIQNAFERGGLGWGKKCFIAVNLEFCLGFVNPEIHCVSEQSTLLCCEHRRSSWLLLTQLRPALFVWTRPLPEPITGWCTGQSPAT